MPMAGEGSRFINEGWTVPKPLIMLKGKPLFMHAVQSVYDGLIPIKYSFIVRKNHIENNKIDKVIKNYLPSAEIFFVEKTTRGAVETCLIAESSIEPDEALIVMDCDLEFKSASFNEEIKHVLNKPVEQTNGGALVSFTSSDSRYSYAKIDDDGNVIKTAEKETISNNALCGAYFFSNASEFLAVAHDLINEKMEKKEFYTSLLYNKILQRGGKVRLCKMEEYYSYGTPEELQRYM